MTNWMTAAGLAFIAGGLATLISFRTVIFGGGARRANRAGSSPRRRRPESVARSRPGPRTTVDAGADEGDESRPERRRRLAAAFSGRPAEGRVEGEVSPSGLASIGLADEDEDEPPYDDDERLGYENGYPGDDSWPPRRRRREPEPDGPAWARRDIENPGGYAGRYTDLDLDVDRGQPGDYWTPLPDELFNSPEIAALPPVPDYEPATGFDPPAVPPIGPMPEWPPRSPTWNQRDRQDDDDAESRPSPRPRPYVSRHSAGPH
ncbi:hypothetical protein [Actinoplanes sichuanensis]|uniref:Secreted protein n=1 Tax=Actinoplanes sichuanensis TaxID=512349 RepID=A0ABW4ARG5_9ACTN|nr:hypothetical protein [Actinoplanes sichuanensis]